MRQILTWIKNNKLEAIIILIIFFVSAFLRFYRLDEYMTFLGDEGRDALVVKKILTEGDIPFIGPPTSVGNIYLGPLYYYLMAIPMAIFWLNPVAPVGMVALIGTGTVVLVYFLARIWFGKFPAVLSASLYSLSFVNVINSRSSWNPYPAPFFALLAILGIYRARKSGNFLWWILTGAALGAVIQMHYLAMLLLPVILILWFWEFYLDNKERVFLHFWLGSLGAVTAFIILIFPLILFDLKHDFLNWRAMVTMFTGQNTALNLNPLVNLGKIWLILKNHLTGRFLGGENLYLTPVLSLLILLPFGLIFLGKYKSRSKWPFFILGTWLVVGLVGLSFYQQAIFDHYLGFLAPVPFLLLGGLISLIKGKWQIVAVLGLMVVVGWFNLNKNPLLAPPLNQLARTQKIAKFIIRESQNKPFNFALIAQRNYDAAYQFYLEIYGHKPKSVPIEITNQLFVVCEDPVCNPVGHAKYEIAAYGWARIDKEYQVAGLRIYKLVPNPTGKSEIVQ